MLTIERGPLPSVGRRGRQGGLSLVELLVGVAVGLFVVAASALLVGNQLASNRRLLLETQLHQDLRATVDIIGRELRRAGYDVAAGSFVWPKDLEKKNERQVVTFSVPTTVNFEYYRGAGEDGPFGFEYVPASKSIRTRLSEDVWQELTDTRSMKVTAFAITDLGTPPTIVPCLDLCADGTTNCWPRMRVRDYRIDITAESATDVAVQRSLSTNVRLRNDMIDYTDPANPTWVCPKP